MTRSHLRVTTDPQTLPPFSISQVSSFAASFADDVRAYAEAGVDAIGVWEMKLGDGPDDDALEQLAASGLGSATAVPGIPSILPLPHFPGPDDPQERIDALCGSVHRLAAFGPTCVVCITGPAGDRDPDEARALAVEGLRAVAGEAASAGVRLALEPFQREGMEDWSLLNTLTDAAELIREIGRDNVGIQLDTWHLWNTPDLFDEIPRHISLVAGVHVNDWREPTRSWCDRALPGEGEGGIAAILGALERAGWHGYYDLEIFSDDGTFGSAFPDSLWALDPFELARRGRESFARCWEERRVAA